MTPVIASVNNPKIKTAVKLRHRHHRKELGLTLVEGIKEVRAALQGGADLQQVFVEEASAESDALRSVLPELTRRAVEIFYLAPGPFQKICYGNRSEGILATARTPELSLKDLELGPAPLLLVIEGLEKPGNLGAVLRTADAAGVDAVILCDGRTDPFNPNAVRASLGTVFTLPLAEAASAEAIQWLRERQVRILAASPDAPTLYTHADLTGPVALAFGSEHLGLSDSWTEHADELIRIPMRGRADSLNLAISASILVFEAIRQRG